MAGYCDAVKDAGLGEFVTQTSYARLDAEHDVTQLLDQKVTAIISHNDSTALGVLDALVSHGLVAGRDVAVVGFDNTALSKAPVLALTTVDPHSQRLGEEAAKVGAGRN